MSDDNEIDSRVEDALQKIQNDTAASSAYTRWSPIPSIAALLFIVIGVGTFYLISTLQPHFTPDQLLREENLRREIMDTAYQCHIKDVCSLYSSTRQECATAGSFKNCLEVKMGAERFNEIDMCTEDGKISWPSSTPPTSLDCLLNKLH
jgi:hypothetical protein